MTTRYYISKYRKIAAGLGLITTCGFVIYERYKINKFLSNLISANVLEIEKKRPNYIYIKYHIYRESMRKIRQKEQDRNWINVIIHPFGKWWKTFKHSVAWRLLNIAQNSGDKHDRLKAVRQLAQIDHLKDWDFRHLAQICDARTAISLARSECDKRWFVPLHKHGVVKNPKLILNDIRDMLDGLKPCSCVDNFLRKYFDIAHIREDDIDEFYPQDKPLPRPDVDLLKESVAFLHHVTKDINNCEKILKQGGLTILLELHKIFSNDNETLATICKAIANISLVKESVEDFFVTGWVGVLAEWLRHPDVRLQVIASKALANLDHDDSFHFYYPPNIYALYPRTRTRNRPKLDVVFIHGLLGGVFYTWRQKDRESNELGLYGKNAFYTSDNDDLFLVGETKFGTGKNNSNRISKNDKKLFRESLTPAETPIINKTRKIESKSTGISDLATKELVETLEMSAELGTDWEVVYPDCPLSSNLESTGDFSISGENWINYDENEEYTNCWPMDWLPEDYPDIRVIGIDYTSAVSQWSANFAKYCPCEKGQGHLDVRATYLLERLSKAGVGQHRPVVWIGHSMGGILCKEILLKALDDPNSKVRQLALNTRGIIFLGTPHRGSPIARWKQHMQMILSPSIEVKELQENSPKLIELHNKFINFIRIYFNNLKIVSIAEGAPTMLTTFKFPIHIVTEDSAFLEVGDFYVLKDDHLSLSKPIFRQSFLYQRLLQVIDDSINIKLNEDDNEENSNPMEKTKKYKQKYFILSFAERLYRLVRPVET